MDRDRNLLFGVFAVQLRQITPTQLVEVAGAWAANPHKDLADRLVETGRLSEADRSMLNDLVNRAIEAHEGDGGATLSHFGGEAAIHGAFRGSIVLSRDGGLSAAPSISADAGSDTGDSLAGVEESPNRYTNEIEHARGGMGRVLLVHDEFLGREIALKELLPEVLAMSGDSSQVKPSPTSVPIVARFLQEARITGQLEHPSIVPVYELGHRTDGSLYYTMKLVRGDSLDKAIKDAGALEERLKLLSHYLDLCQAIAYAHSRGVIHRDIKPANVMVGEFGETVVIDWGLAKIKGREDVLGDPMAKTLRAINQGELENAAKTAYGQAMGTPAYMPPEQARGQLEQIDERSDVYSLGAVLYELLTGAPPFKDGTSGDTLKRVIHEEPLSISENEPGAPPDLVAVCRRAMDKKPSERYASVKELASDIQQFLSGGLVSAHDYTPSQLLVRFTGKYRAILSTAAVALVVLAGFSFVSIARIIDERGRAEKQRDLALEAIYKLTYDVPDRLRDVPRARPVLIEILDENLTLLNRILELNPESKEAHVQKVSNYLGVGRRWLLLGDAQRAVAACEEAVREAQQIVNGRPKDSQALRLLADSYSDLATVHETRGNGVEALEAMENAQDILQKLLALDPFDVDRRFEVARSDLRVANTRARRGERLLRGELVSGRALYEKTRDTLEELILADPENVEMKRMLSSVWRGIAGAGSLEEAVEAFDRSRAILDPLINADPEKVSLKRDLASIWRMKRGLQTEKGDNLGAGESFVKELDILEALLRDDPNNTVHKRSVALASSTYSLYLRNRGRHEEALAAAQKGLALRQELVANDPGSLGFQGSLARALFLIGNVHRSLGDHDAAIDALKQSLDLKIEARARDPEKKGQDSWVADAWHRLANAYAAQGNHEAAKEAHESALKNNASAWGLSNVANARAIAGDTAEAIQYAERAFDGYIEQLLSGRSVSTNSRSDIHETFTLLTGQYRKAGRQDKVLDLRIRYLDFCKALADKQPGDPKVQTDLARQYATAARVANQEDRPDLARDFNEEALEIWKKLSESDPTSEDYPKEIQRTERILERLN